MKCNKQKQTVDLKKGKALYYEYYGNKYGMSLNLGDEYLNCNVPEKIEREWKADVIKILEREISSFCGSDLLSAVDRYMQLKQAEPEWLMSFLNTRKTDTFTALILCELLKDKIRLIKNIIRKWRIRRFLDGFKIKLLSKPVTVDESYLNVAYVRGNEPTAENIKARIKAV